MRDLLVLFASLWLQLQHDIEDGDSTDEVVALHDKIRHTLDLPEDVYISVFELKQAMRNYLGEGQ